MGRWFLHFTSCNWWFVARRSLGPDAPSLRPGWHFALRLLLCGFSFSSLRLLFLSFCFSSVYANSSTSVFGWFPWCLSIRMDEKVLSCECVSFKYTRCGIYISCKASIRWGVRYGRKLNIKKHIIYNLFQCLTGCQNKLNSAPSLPSPPFPSPLPFPSHPPPLAPPFSLPLTPSHSLSHTREGFMRSERQHTFTLLTFTGQNSFIVRARPTPPSPPPPDPLPLTLDPLKQ